MKTVNMTVKELIEKLRLQDPEAEVWVSAINNQLIPTYGLMDHIFDFTFEEVYADLMPTPGDIDTRLLQDKNDISKIVYLGSTFGL